MATCGGSAEVTEEEREQNRQEQRDELVALESIFADTEQLCISCYPGQEDNSVEDGILQILVKVKLPSDTITVDAWAPYEYDLGQAEPSGTTTTSRPHFARSDSGCRWHSSFQVSHLYPLTFQLTLPVGYPSQQPPLFSLSCLWLNAGQLSALCQQLDLLWTENEGMPIIYTWMDWLENSTLSHLCLDKQVIMMPYDERDEAFMVRDMRALPECTNLDYNLGQMLRYNFDEENSEFACKVHSCEICCEEKHGSEFYRLVECKHHFCKDCMAAYCEFHVGEGTVQQLLCPDNDCKNGLPPSIVHSVLGDEAYIRWERLLLQRALDGMGDIEWCPRCNSAVIREEDESLCLAYCTTCGFAFCTKCSLAWHQGEACPNVEAELAELEKQSKKGKEARDTEYKRNKLMQRKNNILSQKTIKQVSKPCPKCKVPIQKGYGCNKIVCSQCGTCICWICGKMIEGYDHFGSGPRACRLFTETGLMREEVYVRPPREQQQGALDVQAALDYETDAHRRIMQCPRCRQRNLKQQRNNHISCWSCKCNMCFQCKNIIQGNVTSHYTAAMPCIQHSD